jgi:NAD(P)-dependent dehydrogenase (short-subunit alcohol dehydrogenase family)
MNIQPGQVAFVTGAAGGIGLGMARAFGAAGLQVAISDIDADALATAAATLAADGIPHLAVVLDVTSSAAWAQAVAQVVGRFGRIDVLCNNAGVGQGRRERGARPRLVDMPEAAFRLVLETNTTSVFLGVRAVVPQMLAQGTPAHIVNTASMAGHIAPAGLGAYAASKFAVVALSESLRAELAEAGIGVSVLCPGGVDTRLDESSEARHAAAAGRPARAGRAMGVPLMQPATVGERVLAAIRTNRLHVFTHPEYEPLVAERQRAVLGAFASVPDSGPRDPEPYVASCRNPCYSEADDTEAAGAADAGTTASAPGSELELLLAEQACLRLMTAYNVRLDAGDFAGFAEVFSADGAWAQVSSPAFEVRGHAAIRKVAERLPPEKIRRHMLQNAQVTVLGPDHAEGFCIGLVVDGPTGNGSLPVPVSAGGVELVAEYRDTYRKGPEGRRITRREMTRILDQKAAPSSPS